MQQSLLPDLGEQSSSAYFSECGSYRYWLIREWDRSLPVLCFCMLNPSTADAVQNDPTVRRCIGFAKRWGYGALCVVNIFALRSTDPSALPKHYPSSPELMAREDEAILAATEGRTVVAAWGVHGRLINRDRQVMELLRGRDVRCLGTTKDGCPRHPLYMKGDTVLITFSVEGK